MMKRRKRLCFGFVKKIRNAISPALAWHPLALRNEPIDCAYGET
jgi:hypothetical protein